MSVSAEKVPTEVRESYRVSERALPRFRREALADGWTIVRSAPIPGGRYMVTIGRTL